MIKSLVKELAELEPLKKKNKDLTLNLKILNDECLISQNKIESYQETINSHQAEIEGILRENDEIKLQNKKKVEDLSLQISQIKKQNKLEVDDLYTKIDRIELQHKNAIKELSEENDKIKLVLKQQNKANEGKVWLLENKINKSNLTIIELKDINTKLKFEVAMSKYKLSMINLKQNYSKSKNIPKNCTIF